MKNGITILLLINFLVFQYARQFSYWECRLANYFKTETKKCDCEKLVKSITGQSQPSQAPVTHHHFHVDECFFPSFTEETRPSYINVSTQLQAVHSSLTAVPPGGPDHPPENELK